MHESDGLNAMSYGMLYCNGQPLGKMVVSSLESTDPTQALNTGVGYAKDTISITNCQDLTLSITVRIPHITCKRMRKLLMSYGIQPREADRFLSWVRHNFKSYGWAFQNYWLLQAIGFQI